MSFLSCVYSWKIKQVLKAIKFEITTKMFHTLLTKDAIISGATVMLNFPVGFVLS